MNEQIEPTTESANTGRVKSSSAGIGSASMRCRQTKSASATATHASSNAKASDNRRRLSMPMISALKVTALNKALSQSK